MGTAEPSPRLDTPLMRQYQALKASHPQAILFFHLGDFYEMFGEDAKAAAPVLGLVLTARQGLAMCGVPVHSAPNYIAKLLKAGHKVAIADQTEDPALAKGLVRRQVVRVVTPGTVVEDELLDAATTNYLVALEIDSVGWGLACAEVSTGEFWAAQLLNDAGRRQLFSLLARLDPSEVLVSNGAAEELKLKAALPRASVTVFDTPPRPEPWCSQPPWPNRSLAAKAGLKARRYITESRSHVAEAPLPVYREASSEMQLDETAIRTLELVASSTGERRHALWGVLDRCRTPMGSRRMKQWVLHPLTDLSEIALRQNGVEELLEKPEARRTLSEILDETSDLERVVSRLTTRAASPRDLAALRNSLLQLSSVRGWLSDLGAQEERGSALSRFWPVLQEASEPLEKARALLERALADRPPAKVTDGGVIRAGFDSSLDELRTIKGDVRAVLSDLEAKERAATGIPSLKVGFNSVFGYYLEVTKAHQGKVPHRYVRKQTLTGAERYITSELKELEVKVLGAEEKILRLEARLFEQVRSEVVSAHDALRRYAGIVAELDVLSSLAQVAEAENYVKPKVDLSHDLVIEEGRHPAVEQALPPGTFVPNSLELGLPRAHAVILTGPNMGGKSTFLRQNALIAVMAQMGSFVPAKSARIGLVDKILTRIGSQDALARAESTFMVEMRETAHILASATLRSLIILDEVGRGTSTFDGISIAWAVLEHLNKAYRSDKAPGPDSPLGPRTLFATHYFELTELADSLPGIVNSNVEAKEWRTPEGKTEVVFLHRISPGPADRSFGIHVAQLAGLPAPCLARAREILAKLEQGSPAPASKGSPKPEPLLPLFDEHPVLRELRSIEPDQLTPVEALNRLAALKKAL